MFNVRLPKSLKSLCFLELDRAVFQKCFFAPGGPNPLKSLERCLSEVRKINFDRKFSRPPAVRERRSTPGAAPPGTIGSRIGGRMARRNRRVEPEGRMRRGPAVKPNGAWDVRLAAAGRRAGQRAGQRAGKTEWSRTVPTGFFVCFFSGASAGRDRRTSGVDGADIGRGTCGVKEYYRKKGNIFGDRPGSRLFAGEAFGAIGRARQTR